MSQEKVQPDDYQMVAKTSNLISPLKKPHEGLKIYNKGV